MREHIDPRWSEDSNLMVLKLKRINSNASSAEKWSKVLSGLGRKNCWAKSKLLILDGVRVLQDSVHLIGGSDGAGLGLFKIPLEGGSPVRL